MFNLTHPLPPKVYVAVSGGMDSMAALNWLHRSGKVYGIIHIHHSSGAFADRARDFVLNYARHRYACYDYQYPEDGIKTEEAWREFRYDRFRARGLITPDIPVVTAHHADDCLEEYLLCVTKRGYMGTIPYRNNNVIRPFRNWKKEDIKDYVIRNCIDYIEDPSNTNTDYTRNKIRHEIIPHLKEINPGIYNLVEEAVRIQDKYDLDNTNNKRFLEL